MAPIAQVATDAAVDDVKPHAIRPMPDVREWLVSLGLAQYADAFEDNAIRWDVLFDLDHDVLKDIG